MVWTVENDLDVDSFIVEQDAIKGVKNNCSYHGKSSVSK